MSFWIMSLPCLLLCLTFIQLPVALNGFPIIDGRSNCISPLRHVAVVRFPSQAVDNVKGNAVDNKNISTNSTKDFESFFLSTADALGVNDRFEPDTIFADGELAGKWYTCRVNASASRPDVDKNGCRVDQDYIDRISFGFRFTHLSNPNSISRPVPIALSGVARPELYRYSFDSSTLSGEFTVKYNCGKTQEDSILSVLQLSVPVTPSRNVTIQWGKICKSGVNKLIDFGYVTSSGEMRSFLRLDDSVMMVGPTSSFTELYLSVLPPAVSQDFLVPTIVSANESIVTAAVRGDAGNGTITSKRSAKIAIMYSCIGHGETSLDVKIQVPPWSDMTTSFKKDCGGGVATSVSIGTSRSLDDIVSHGAVTEKYKPSFFHKLGRLQASLSSPDVNENQHESTFVIRHDGPPGSESIHFSNIILTVGDRTFLRVMQESYVSTSSYLGKSGGVLAPGESRMLVLHYICLRAGRSYVVVSLPLLRYATIEFGIVKQCKGPTVHEARSFFNVRAIEDIVLASIVGAVLLLCVVRRCRDLSQKRQGAVSRPEKYENVPVSES